MQTFMDKIESCPRAAAAASLRHYFKNAIADQKGWREKESDHVQLPQRLFRQGKSEIIYLYCI